MDNRSEAYWSEETYCVPVRAGFRIYERLGIIDRRDDGRWNWWRKNSDFQKSWRGAAQGVARSRSEAMAQILDGWHDDESLPVTSA